METHPVFIPSEDLILLRSRYYQCNPQIQYNLYQNPNDIFFLQKYKILMTFIQNLQETEIAKTILKENKAGRGFAFPDFKTYYETAVAKTVCYQHKDIQINGAQQSPKIYPHIHGPVIFNKDVRLFNGELIVFSTNGSGKIGYPPTKE